MLAGDDPHQGVAAELGSTWSAAAVPPTNRHRCLGAAPLALADERLVGGLVGNDPIIRRDPALPRRVSEGGLRWVDEAFLSLLPTEDVATEIARIGEDGPDGAGTPRVPRPMGVPGGVVRARRGNAVRCEDGGDALEADARVHVQAEDAMHDRCGGRVLLELVQAYS
jgi:hypothetical protein